ncbi:NAD(+)/NADH kinase [Magnetococcales bacterium HHB-1]
MKHVRRVGIITKLSEERARQAALGLVTWFLDRDIIPTLTKETLRDGRLPKGCDCRPQDDLSRGQDLLVVLGGDGTFLVAARTLKEENIPILGINMGRLGFLTEVPDTDMFSTLKDVLAGRYRIEKRVMFSVEVERRGEKVLQQRVLNDAVIHKGELARMIEFEVEVDRQFVFSSRADGLILSTPTGSTAYALSAGGPIVHPALEAILMVPICPHTLANRPILVPGQGEVAITMVADDAERLLTLDGQSGFVLEDGDRLLIRQSRHRLRLLHAPERNYYDILRRKLRWGEKVGN